MAMIGKIITGKSFKNCIAYCLRDKQKLSVEDTNKLSPDEQQLQHHHRAEVLEYNRCFGTIKELTEQMDDVKKQSRRIEKPVLHMTLRPAPGDRTLTNNELIEIGRKCAAAFGVAGHQYLSILHKDTAQQHIHIVANCVGFDGKAAKDNHNYRRMAAFCRSIEQQYHLTEVPSPRAFLSQKERLIPRQDTRKEKLKNDIAAILKSGQISTYETFAQRMKALGYQVEKGRGIAFIDDRKVRIKGSEVGFSLGKIEKILSLKLEIIQKENRQNILTTQQLIEVQKPSQQRKLSQPVGNYQYPAFDKQTTIIETLQTELRNIFYDIMRPEMGNGGYLPEPLEKRKKKKRRQQLRR